MGFKMSNEFVYTIYGSSNKKHFVYCNKCNRKFSWLKAKQTKDGEFIAVCQACRKFFNKKK